MHLNRPVLILAFQICVCRYQQLSCEAREQTTKDANWNTTSTILKVNDWQNTRGLCVSHRSTEDGKSNA